MMLASCLDEAGHGEEAIEANREAIDVYTPCLLALPEAFAHRANPMAQEYIDRCEKLGREPDHALLAPVMELLQRMHEDLEGEEAQGEPDC